MVKKERTGKNKRMLTQPKSHAATIVVLLPVELEFRYSQETKGPERNNFSLSLTSSFGSG